MDPVRRSSDGELCGHVERDGEHWRSLTVFGAELGRHERRDDAVEKVLRDGLASLSDRWLLRHGEDGEDQVVCIVEANADEVTLALDYYAMPGVPRLTIAASDIASGEWRLTR